VVVVAVVAGGIVFDWDYIVVLHIEEESTEEHRIEEGIDRMHSEEVD